MIEFESTRADYITITSILEYIGFTVVYNRPMKNGGSKIVKSQLKTTVLVCLFLVISIGGIKYANYIYQQSKSVTNRQKKLEYPQYVVKPTGFYSYNVWKAYEYSGKDFTFMVPNSFTVVEQKQNSSSPCNNKILIYMKGQQNDSDIQIDKCPQKNEEGYPDILSDNNVGVSTVRLDNVDGYIREGVFTLYGGNVKGQNLMVYKDNYAYSIFRNLDSSKMTDNQFNQFLASFKFTK